MSGFVTKTLKFKLGGSEVVAQYGDLVLKSNAETVTKMITTVSGVVGVENCVKMGTTAIAIYFVAKSMLKYWPWMRINNVKNDNVLEIEIPKKHEDKFNEMVENRKIDQNVNTDFEDIDTNLEGVVGEDACAKYGKEIKELIEHFRFKSVVRSVSDLPENLVANEIIACKNEDTIRDKHVLVLAGEKVSGVVANNFFRESAEVKRTIEGGGVIVAAGFKGEDLKKIMDAQKELAGNWIKITVKGKHLSEPFEGKFRPTDTIFHVIRAIKKKERKNVSIFRDCEELDDDISIAEVARTGSVLTLEALTDPETGDQQKSKSVVAGEIIAGKCEDTKTDCNTSILVREQSSGTVAGVIVKEGGVLDRTIQGGNATIGVGFEGEDLKNIVDTHKELAVRKGGQVSGGVVNKYIGEKAGVKRGGGVFVAEGSEGEDWRHFSNIHNELADNSIKIIVEGKYLSEPFEGKFEPTETISHVIRAIQKKEGKNVSIFRDGEEIDVDATILEVARTGSVLTLKALTDTEVNALNPSMEH